MASTTEVVGTTAEFPDVSGMTMNELAQDANETYGRCRAAANQAVQNACKAGTLLIEAKARCPRGSWMQWLKGTQANLVKIFNCLKGKEER